MQPSRRRVLERLADAPASGPELARDLDMTRAAVWKHIEALRAADVDIAGEADGYRLKDTPAFGEPAVALAVPAFIDVEYYDEIESTNDRARELADGGERGVAVVADRQLAGRGRLGRAWTAPPGGIYMSLLLEPGLSPAEVPLLTLASAVATVDGMAGIEFSASIKWPNDVLVCTDGRERKLAGILTEVEGEADRVRWAIVGIGINANVDDSAIPASAASIASLMGEPVNRAHLLGAIVTRLLELLETPDEIIPAWRERAVTLNRRVRVERDDEIVVGTAVDIAPHGALIVKTENGTERIHAGDCQHLRPVDDRC